MALEPRPTFPTCCQSLILALGLKLSLTYGVFTLLSVFTNCKSIEQLDQIDLNIIKAQCAADIGCAHTEVCLLPTKQYGLVSHFDLIPSL